METVLHSVDPLSVGDTAPTKAALRYPKMERTFAKRAASTVLQLNFEFLAPN